MLQYTHRNTQRHEPGGYLGLTEDFEMLFTFKSTDHALQFCGVAEFHGLHCDVVGNTAKIDSLLSVTSRLIHVEWLSAEALRINA